MSEIVSKTGSLFLRMMKNSQLFMWCVWLGISSYTIAVCEMMAHEVCDRSCLDNPEINWPPKGFVDSERTVRCSLRCQMEPVSCLSCWLYTVNSQEEENAKCCCGNNVLFLPFTEQTNLQLQ